MSLRFTNFQQRGGRFRKLVTLIRLILRAFGAVSTSRRALLGIEKQ